MADGIMIIYRDEHENNIMEIMNYLITVLLTIYTLCVVFYLIIMVHEVMDWKREGNLTTSTTKLIMFITLLILGFVPVVNMFFAVNAFKENYCK